MPLVQRLSGSPESTDVFDAYLIVISVVSVMIFAYSTPTSSVGAVVIGCGLAMIWVSTTAIRAGYEVDRRYQLSIAVSLVTLLSFVAICLSRRNTSTNTALGFSGTMNIVAVGLCVREKHRLQHVENRRRIIRLFVANGLMQKFSIVRTAVETAIADDHSNGNSRSSNKLKDLRTRLEQIHNECAYSEQKCFQKLQVTPNTMDSQQNTKPTPLPPNLKIAVLDDSLLVRLNLQRLCSKDLGASKKCTFKGATYDECIQFCKFLEESHMDIAIFDENLEYGDGLHVSGADIARQARQKGFTGCMIRHSSQPLSLSPEGDGDVFDGVIDKASTKDELIQGVCKAWIHYRARRRLHGLQKSTQLARTQHSSDVQQLADPAQETLPSSTEKIGIASLPCSGIVDAPHVQPPRGFVRTSSACSHAGDGRSLPRSLWMSEGTSA